MFSNLRFCNSPIIVPICTKVDTKEDILSEDVIGEILSCCKKVIHEKTEKKRKVILFNEVIHFTSKANFEELGDKRKNSKYLRDLLAALCDFYFQEQFLIPNSWNKIGKDELI